MALKCLSCPWQYIQLHPKPGYREVRTVQGTYRPRQCGISNRAPLPVRHRAPICNWNYEEYCDIMGPQVREADTIACFVAFKALYH